jgi:hypothetical protein
MRTTVFLALFLCAGLAAAQSDGERGSTPPGLSQDGSRPAEGAIKGGSIAPGESGGMPDKGGSATGDAAAGGTASNLARCYQLEGTLREQCLAHEREAPLSRGSEAPRAPTSGEPARRD